MLEESDRDRPKYGKGRRDMTAKNWHPGKIVMIWVIAAFWLVMGLSLVQDSSTEDFGVILLIGWVNYVLWVFIKTWKWFTAREKSG